MILYKIIGVVLGYMAIGIAVWSFACVAMEEPEPRTEETLFGVVIWPILFAAVIAWLIGEGIKFLFKKMMNFWQAVLPSDEDDN